MRLSWHDLPSKCRVLPYPYGSDDGRTCGNGLSTCACLSRSDFPGIGDLGGFGNSDSQGGADMEHQFDNLLVKAMEKLP